MSVEWVFDPGSPSGARRGGNAAEYGFEGHIDTLIRETVQNSMDAGNPTAHTVDIRFRLVELTGERLSQFLDAMAWTSLRDNLEAVERHGEPIRKAMAQLEEQDRILLLCIEDRETAGLTGSEKREEDSERNRFSALVRDELYSDKDSADAGGSFGLGKILLWAYSAFKTVLFASIPVEHPEGKSGLRFIGRTSLPYHETDDDGRCSGPGWLGVPQVDPQYGDRGRWAESLWGDEAHELAASCQIPRAPDEFGLSTVIVGFEEPGQDTRDIESLVASIEKAALESFWPAITRGQVSIQVSYERDHIVQTRVTVDPRQHPQFEILADMLVDYDRGSIKNLPRLETAGDTTWRHVDLEVPQRIIQDGMQHGALTGQVTLLVRLLDEDEDIDDIRDRVYRFRKPGMIVRNSGTGSLSVSARPYVAAVLCGRASGDDQMHDYVEWFLRAAEPPEHDRWEPDTRAIKESYNTYGVKARLLRFENNLRVTIRDLVSLGEKKGGSLPLELLKYLRFGDATGGGNPRFLTSTVDARPEGNTWNFVASVNRSAKVELDGKPWCVSVRLKYAVDGGGAEDIHAIGEIDSPKKTASKIANGTAWLEFPADVKSVRLSGKADPAALPAVGTHSAINIIIDGVKGAIEDV
jgi:hypothetical protein